MRGVRMNDIPIDLDKHRGMAAQKATDIRRVVADVETKAKLLRDHQGEVEIQLLAVPAVSWIQAPAKARYVLNLYPAPLPPPPTHPPPPRSPGPPPFFPPPPGTLTPPPP